LLLNLAILPYIQSDLKQDLINQHNHQIKQFINLNEEYILFSPAILLYHSSPPSDKLDQRIYQKLDYFRYEYSFHIQQVVRNQSLLQQQQHTFKEFNKMTDLFNALDIRFHDFMALH